MADTVTIGEPRIEDGRTVGSREFSTVYLGRLVDRLARLRPGPSDCDDVAFILDACGDPLADRFRRRALTKTACAEAAATVLALLPGQPAAVTIVED